MKEDYTELSLSVEEAIEKLKEYKEKTGKSQAKIAREMGVSEGVVSAFLSNTYKAMENIVPKVEQLLSITTKKEVAPREPGFKRTSVSTTVLNLIAYCHVSGKIGLVYGDAGVGKTMAIREYKKQNPDTAVVITISPCFATMTGVNELLAEELHVQEKVSRKIQKECIKKLRGTNKVVIVDEAQHLTVRVINHLRCIADESGVGMAFIGNDEIYTKMHGSGQAAYAQLFSRIADPEHVVTHDVKRKDIELLFEDIDMPDEAIEILYKISHTNYGVRGAVNVFLNAASAFGTITTEGVAAMAKKMSIV